MDSASGAVALPTARCRIRASPDQGQLTAPRGFSQPTTPFIGSWRQGIPRTPFVAPRPLPRGRATRRILCSVLLSAVVKVRDRRPRERPLPRSSVPVAAPRIAPSSRHSDRPAGWAGSGLVRCVAVTLDCCDFGLLSRE
jgi:hypothetical protein